MMKLICTAAISMVALWAGPAVADRTPWTHLNYQNDPDEFQFAIVPGRSGGDYRNAFTNALAKVNLTLDGILPGDFMDQSRTLWTNRIEPLDYPVTPKTVERLKALKEKQK